MTEISEQCLSLRGKRLRLWRNAAQVTFAMILLDLVFAFYVIKTAEKQAVAAGLLSAGIIVLSGYVTRAYVDDKRMLIPAAVGAFVGTAVAVLFA